MKSTSIKIGDKFTKSEEPNTVWIVRRLVKIQGLLPHAELTAQGYLRRTMMLSQEALTDQNLYRRIEKS